MVVVTYQTCNYDTCDKRPTFNYLGNKTPLYCSEHKLKDMYHTCGLCKYDNCTNQASYNYQDGSEKIYCYLHKEDRMIPVRIRKCIHTDCINKPSYGFKHKRPTYCHLHKLPNMINLKLDNKCNMLDCDNQYFITVKDVRYCLDHVPNNYEKYILNKKCKYCDIEEKSTYVCSDCSKIKNKKEWAIVRYIRRNIDLPFEYNTSKMLAGCSKKRPDVYFELNKHCVIVEIDEHQHKSYEDVCECARINEIVNGIGGKSVIIIRYNPDKIYNNKKLININQLDRVTTLIETIKKELSSDYNQFGVKLIQLYYDDNYSTYNPIKTEMITNKVCL